MLICNGVRMFTTLTTFEKNMFTSKGMFWWESLFFSFKHGKQVFVYAC